MTTARNLEPLVRGAVELQRTDRGLLPQRLPSWALAQADDPQLTMAASQPAGVRVAFRTAASVVELDVVPTKREYVGMPRRPDGVHQLVVDGVVLADASVARGDVLAIDLATGGFEHRPGEPATVRFELPDGEHDVELWLPHDETTVLVALRTDAPVGPPPARPVWVHHGSSLSQGSNAAVPTGTWVATAARAAGVDLVNLGLGGSALLDQFTARTIRDLPADAISLELGINVVNTDLMRLRAFTSAVHGFLDTIRDGHPTTPLLVVSPLLCPIHEETPGPAAIDPASFAGGSPRFVATGDPADVARGRLTVGTVRAELARIVADRSAADPALAHLDGRELYGEADAETMPLPDDLHLGPEAHRVAGERFAAAAFGPDGPLRP